MIFYMFKYGYIYLAYPCIKCYLIINKQFKISKLFLIKYKVAQSALPTFIFNHRYYLSNDMIVIQ